jgi:hypothetical protein
MRTTAVLVLVFVSGLAGAAAAATGDIRVTCVEGTRVFVDGQETGAGYVAGLAPGWHTMVAIGPHGYQSREVEVLPHRTAEVVFSTGSPGSSSGQDGVVVPHRRCLVPDLPRPAEGSQEIRDRLEAEGRWARSGGAGRTPPPDPQLGDSWDWYIWDLGGFPVATLKPCTVRGLGQHCYVVVDDDEWNVSIDQADVDRIVDHFDQQSVGDFPDQGIWDLNTSHFGDPPNPLDGLDRIFLLYYRFNISADGYFWVYDQYPDGTQPFASNEADVVYLATDNNNAGGDYMLAVAAHEFEHMIHFNQDDNEASWVDEGLGELAMWLFGHPDTISGFNSNPDNSLTHWGGNWVDYIQTYLWTLYAYEQFGGQTMIYDLVHNPANSMSGYFSTLTGLGYTVTMEDVYRDWSAANYLDDPAVPDGQYGYVGETLPPFVAFRTHDTYPAAGAGTVQNWATDYIRLVAPPGVPNIDFDGQDTRDFRLVLMALDPVLPTLVQPVTVDGSGDASFIFAAAEGYGEVIVAVDNVHPTAMASYAYGVDTRWVPVFSDGFESGNWSAWARP